MDSKPFEPTASRVARARREGDRPLSPDAVAVAAFGSAAIAIVASAPLVVARMRALAASAAALRADPRGLWICALPVAAVGTAAACGAVAASLAQTGGFALRMPSPRLGFKPPFSREAAASALRALAATAAAAWAIASLVRGSLTSAFAPPPYEASARAAFDGVARALGAAGGIGAILALAGVATARASWRRRLRMTHDELRRDLHENDGDPEMRARRKRMHRSIVRGSLRGVRRASFVVVNPDHVAVAIRYDAVETPVPEILVRALDQGALRVKALAREANVPIVDDPALARSLYAHGALGPIPRELYVAVAQVVASLARRLQR